MNWAANHDVYHIRKWANILSVYPAVQLHDVKCHLVEPFDLFKSNIQHESLIGHSCYAVYLSKYAR